MTYQVLDHISNHLKSLNPAPKPKKRPQERGCSPSRSTDLRIYRRVCSESNNYSVIETCTSFHDSPTKYLEGSSVHAVSMSNSTAWCLPIQTYLRFPSPVPELSFLPAPYRGWARIGHFRLLFCLCFKASQSAKPFLGHPNKMFRFPSPSLSWRWVGRSVGQKNKKEWMHEGFWVTVKAGLLNTKAWNSDISSLHTHYHIAVD